MGLVEVMAWWAWGEVPGEGEAPPGFDYDRNALPPNYDFSCCF